MLVPRAVQASASDRCRESLLAGHPHIGRHRDEDLRPGLRSFPVGEYVIIYRVEGKDVLILHIFRGSRDIEALLRQ
jgi:toxin ParE1/3/4